MIDVPVSFLTIYAGDVSILYNSPLLASHSSSAAAVGLVLEKTYFYEHYLKSNFNTSSEIVKNNIALLVRGILMW